MSHSGDDDVEMAIPKLEPDDSGGPSHDLDVATLATANLERRSASQFPSAMDVDVGDRRKDGETEVERAISVEKGKRRADDGDALTWYLPDRLRGQPLDSVILRLQKNAHLFWRNQQNANMQLVIPTPGSSKRQPPRPPPPPAYQYPQSRPAPREQPYYPYPPDPRMSSYWGPSPYPYPYWPPPPMYGGYGPPPVRDYDYPPHSRTSSSHARRERRSPSPEAPPRHSLSGSSSRHKKALHDKTRGTPEASPEPGQKSPPSRSTSERVPPAFPLYPAEPPSASSGSRESPYALRPEYPGYQQPQHPGYADYYPPESTSRRSGPSERPVRPADEDGDREETITYAVHKEYFLTQCSLIQFMCGGLDKHAPKDLVNPIASYSFQPAPRKPYHLKDSTMRHPRIHLALPDPDSFGQILEWLYFGPAAYPHLEEAMEAGRVTWGGLVRNAEWLGVSSELKNWLGRHWKKSMEEGRTEKDVGNKPIGSNSPSPAIGANEQLQRGRRSAEPESARPGQKPKEDEDRTPTSSARYTPSAQQ
ncbi:hypothetical protein CALVIDRAFT_559725 [Calocera viscosa TUFC12733]|uniref:BTB domain-containing protein n=1 Tax=Calocera viscosa (strain TUFC12733) TaxID=1330018 RepID=A0A167RMC2_CALVF|nr:hypothetical protein CALVIDRAFT_559725 [Calocera viscosa TUFC12733]